MIDQMLFEHEAPFLDDVEQCLLEWLAVDSEPSIEHVDAIELGHLVVDLLVRVDLFEGRYIEM